MRKRAVGETGIALAALSLANNKLAALAKAGVLNPAVVEAVYAASIEEQSRFRNAPNQDAAYILQRLRDSDESVLPPRL